MSSLLWSERMHSDTVVAGLPERRRKACLRAGQMLNLRDNGNDPTLLSEQQVREYLQECGCILQSVCAFA